MALPKAQELCESRGGRPGLTAPNKPDSFCGRKATLKSLVELRNCVKVGVVRPGLPVSNGHYSLCGRKATLKSLAELRNCVKVEAAVSNSHYSLCGRKVTFNLNVKLSEL